MYVTRVPGGDKIVVSILLVEESDYRKITKKRYFFNWKIEKSYTVYKLEIQDQKDILGLVSIDIIEEEKRIEIRLIAVAKEQVGNDKTLDRITGNLFAFVARLAVKKFGVFAAVSLTPKTSLSKYYINKYGFEQAGSSLFLEGKTLLNLIKLYDDE
jgi:hypothetical protein